MELIAAVIGASLGIIAGGVSGFLRKDRSEAIAVVRLTAAVEHIASEVSLMREEIRQDRQELYPRINQIENRLTKLEAQQ